MTQSHAPTDASGDRSIASSVDHQPQQELGLKPGELVRVRPASQIFSTLDATGSLDGMPFMPEMREHCGRSFRVGQRSDKTCAGDGVVRRMHNTVHLQGVRCDGAAHGGCQAACLCSGRRRGSNGSQATTASSKRRPTATMTSSSPRRLSRPRRQRMAVTGARRPRFLAHRRPCGSGRPISTSEDVRNWSLGKIVRGLIIDAFNI